MSAPGKAAVPKFSSFKPPVKRPAVADQGEAAPTKRRRSTSPHEPTASQFQSSRHHHRHHYHGKDQGRRQDRHRDDASSRGARASEQPLIQTSRQPSPPVTSELYTVDRKGDPQNWTYQRLHKYSVPAYRRTGYGNVLGLALRYRIDPEISIEDKVYLVDARRRPGSGRERALLKRPKRQQLSELRLSSHLRHESFDPTLDFVSLRSSRQANRHPAQKPKDQSLDEIRSLQDIGSTISLPADSDLVYASSDSDYDDSDLDAQIRQRNVELSRMTKSEPTNITHWLNLIAHQEFLVRPAASGAVSPDLTDTERRTLADLRLHIFEKASKCILVHDKTARETLLHAMFSEAFIVWDLPKYLHKLSDAIRELPASFLLWTMYLDAAQTRSAAFRFEEGKAFFLQSLRSMQSISTLSDASADGVEDMHLYIILRYTTYLRDSGYDELSIAIWQALFEYHLFRPEETSQYDRDAALQSFEDFWESEVARFGETGSQGWSAFISEDASPAENVSMAPDGRLNPQYPFRSFSILESSTSDALRFPGRTTEECGSEDPFHIVFFSDLRDVLEATPFTFSQDGLVDAFLCYLGLPVRVSSARDRDHHARIRDWRSDSFLSNGLLTQLSSVYSSRVSQRPCVERYEAATQNLFADLCFPKFELDDTKPGNQSSTHRGVLTFARISLASLVNKYQDDERLAEYFLAFECNYYPDDASKTAKKILKRRPSSLLLYNVCAIIESKLGRTDKASHVWAGALKMKDSFPPEAQAGAVVLWQSWTWSEMRRGETQAALSRLISFDGSVEHNAAAVVSSSATLRVKKYFKEGFEHALARRDAHLTSLNAECLALLAYLSQSDALSAAMDVFDQYCTLSQSATDKPSADLALELLHQAKARVIEYHVQQQRPYKPALVRLELDASIKLFPSNTTFLWLYKENEARFRIDDRVRAVLRDPTKEDKKTALVRVSFELDQEMTRFSSQLSGSTVESVRATFARALLAKESPVRHSSALWTRWFRFEERVVQRHAATSSDLDKRSGQQVVRKMKEVFLGGLRHLPWVKQWVLNGLESFDSEQSLTRGTLELRSLYNVLHERELRVRVEGLDDLLDSITETR